MRRRARPLDRAEAAWIAAVPCAVATVLAILLLGPPLGNAFLASGPDRFWPNAAVHPEPVEHARYLIALLGVSLFASVVLTSPRWTIRLEGQAIRALVTAGELAVSAFLVLCLLAQHNVIFRSYILPVTANPLFTNSTVAVAVCVAALVAAALRRAQLRGRLVRLASERLSVRIACVVAAAGLTALWLSTAVDFDSTIGNARLHNLIPWDMSETFAVLDGRTPLVDVHAQYAHLWPYPAALVMALLGPSIGVWTVLMASISGLALLAIYAVFRRIVGSSLLALALYLPFMATGFFILVGPLSNRASPTAIFSLWPLRYSGPYLLAWLTARHLGDAVPRRSWLLFTAAGLVLINNVEFGAGASAATGVAVACQAPPSTWRAARQLAAAAAAGLAAAGALVSLLTLVRAGSLPDFPSILEFTRLYGVGGWVLETMAPMGFHLALYVTFAAAIVLAVVRAMQGGREPVLTGMLAWSGVFGLVAGGYFAGRSDSLNLISLFSPWCFALTLLVIAVVRSIVQRASHRATVSELAVLFGLGLMICSLPQIPTPWSQVDRLRKHTPIPLFEQPAAKALVARMTRPGERVVILIPLGHRIAYDVGVVDVAPYTGIESMPTVQQMDLTVAVAHREHVHTIFVENLLTYPEERAALVKAGYANVVEHGQLTTLSDRPVRS